eukprot:10361449-Alexandrium_andersonii.AAC.1
MMRPASPTKAHADDTPRFMRCKASKQALIGPLQLGQRVAAFGAAADHHSLIRRGATPALAQR